MSNKPKFNVDHWEQWLHQEVEGASGLASSRTIINYLRDGDNWRFNVAGYRVLQCLIMPSFEPWVSYEVYREKDVEWLLKITCSLVDPRPRPQVGERRRVAFLPVMQFEFCEVKHNAIKPLMAILNQPIVGFERGGFGLDGTLYELFIKDRGFQAIRYKWWERPSSGWAPIWEGFQAMVTAFESELELADTRE